MARIRRFRGRVLPTVDQMITEGAFPTPPVEDPVEEPVDEPIDEPIESLAYTVMETATLLNISKNTVYKYVKDGSIPSTRVGAKVLIPKTATIFKWLKTTTGEERFNAEQS